MRVLKFLGLILLFSFSIKAQQNKPNVIYILADDLGYGDLSIYGQKKFKTPNLDKLGRQGIKFTNHYSGNAVCSPSRAVLLSGQHPGNCPIIGNSRPEATLVPEMKVLPEVFKDAGYTTGAFGKWGLGFTNEEAPKDPRSHGFDEFYGWKTQSTAHTYYPKTMVHNGKEVEMEAGTYVHDEIMKNAYDFITKNAKSKKPFFCYIPTAIPHAAMHAPKKIHDEWREKLPQFDTIVGKYYAHGEECPDVINPVAAFPAMVQHLDSQVGDIMDLLVKYGQDKNTLIIFTSDNGAHDVGGHNPEFWNSTGPFRGMKRDMYEGGIRTPMLAYWPGTIKPNSVTDHPSAFWDVMATAADLVGQPVPKQCDGISFLPTLLGKKASEQEKHKYLYWRINAKRTYAHAVRIGDLKGVFITYPKTKKQEAKELPFELYNLSEDISEKNNIANQHPEIVEKMMNIINKYK